MNNSNKSLKQKSATTRWLAIVFIIVSFIGFADASYLTIEHLRGVSPNCSFLEGCDVVTSSKYSEVLGIPVALPGALFYLSILILSILHLDSKKPKYLRLAFLLSPLGFLASMYFLSLMLFVLKAICIYCMVSVGTSTTLFILGMFGLKKTNKEIDMLPKIEQEKT